MNKSKLHKWLSALKIRYSRTIKQQHKWKKRYILIWKSVSHWRYTRRCLETPANLRKTSDKRLLISWLLRSSFNNRQLTLIFQLCRKRWDRQTALRSFPWMSWGRCRPRRRSSGSSAPWKCGTAPETWWAWWLGCSPRSGTWCTRCSKNTEPALQPTIIFKIDIFCIRNWFIHPRLMTSK